MNLNGQGRYVDAEALYRRALTIREARLGAHHPETAQSLNNLATNLRSQSRYGDAEPLLRRALSIYDARLGANHPETALTLENLTGIELKLSQFESALSHARKAFRTRESRRAAAGPAMAQDTRGQLNDKAGDSGTYLVRAAWGFAQQQMQVAPLRAEAFAAAQSIRLSSSADALAQGAARVAAESAGVGLAVAAWREAQNRIAALDTQIAQAAGQGSAGDALRSTLGTERAAAVNQLDAAERDLATRFPRYFDLLKASPLSVADLQAATGDAARLLAQAKRSSCLRPAMLGCSKDIAGGWCSSSRRRAPPGPRFPWRPIRSPARSRHYTPCSPHRALAQRWWRASRCPVPATTARVPSRSTARCSVRRRLPPRSLARIAG